MPSFYVCVISPFTLHTIARDINDCKKQQDKIIEWQNIEMIYTKRIIMMFNAYNLNDYKWLYNDDSWLQNDNNII